MKHPYESESMRDKELGSYLFMDTLRVTASAQRFVVTLLQDTPVLYCSHLRLTQNRVFFVCVPAKLPLLLAFRAPHPTKRPKTNVVVVAKIAPVEQGTRMQPS